MNDVFISSSNHRSPILSAGLSDCTARLWIDISCQFIKCLSHLSHPHSLLREISRYRGRSSPPFYLPSVASVSSTGPPRSSTGTGPASHSPPPPQLRGARTSCRSARRHHILRGASRVCRRREESRDLLLHRETMRL